MKTPENTEEDPDEGQLPDEEDIKGNTPMITYAVQVQQQ
jgi:hypothetical protein